VSKNCEGHHYSPKERKNQKLLLLLLSSPNECDDLSSSTTSSYQQTGNVPAYLPRVSKLVGTANGASDALLHLIYFDQSRNQERPSTHQST
jgi:hypothetical protein